MRVHIRRATDAPATLGKTESLQEAVLINRCQRHGLPEPVTQYKVIPNRRFRYDLAWPEYRVCCDVQGAVWTNGRHVRGAGYENDLLKSALAQLEGWIAIAVTPGQVESGMACMLIAAALAAHGWVP